MIVFLLNIMTIFLIFLSLKWKWTLPMEGRLFHLRNLAGQGLKGNIWNGLFIVTFFLEIFRDAIFSTKVESHLIWELYCLYLYHSAAKDDLTDKIDFIICLGGDGTLLHASTLFQVITHSLCCLFLA